MSWISVKDRLPKSGKEVLFITGWKTMCVGFYRDFSGWSNGEFVGIDVTHWMPLPKPPKEEDDE